MKLKGPLAKQAMKIDKKLKSMDLLELKEVYLRYIATLDNMSEEEKGRLYVEALSGILLIRKSDRVRKKLFNKALTIIANLIDTIPMESADLDDEHIEGFKEAIDTKDTGFLARLTDEVLDEEEFGRHSNRYYVGKFLPFFAFYLSKAYIRYSLYLFRGDMYEYLEEKDGFDVLDEMVDVTRKSLGITEDLVIKPSMFLEKKKVRDEDI